MGPAARLFQCFTVALILGVLAGCGGGNTPDPGPAPVITGLSRAYAAIGQEITISGANFGAAQDDSTVRLGGTELIILAWTGTQVTVQVPPGAASGTIVVEVNGQSSPGGPGAELNIVLDPNDPRIQSLSQSYGEPGDVVEISGINLGTVPGSVHFAADDGTEYDAAVSVEEAGGEEVIQWTTESVSIIVPVMPAGSYTLYMRIGNWESHGLAFTCIDNRPLIAVVIPGYGVPGSMVQLLGENFGAEQGASTVMLNDLPLVVDEWSATEISARIPVGAASGKIRIVVSAYPEYQWPSQPGGAFIVGDIPEVTGIDPGVLRFGQPITIHGTGFQGVETVTIGRTEQPIAASARHGSALTSSVTISGLKPFSTGGVSKEDVDGNLILNEFGLPVMHYEVQVELDNGMKSTPVLVPFDSNLKATVSVNRTTGERDGDAGEAGMVFSFTPAVTGGSGDYTYYLAPEITDPVFWSVDRDASSPDSLEYTYPADPSANYEEEYDTRFWIIDNETGDELMIKGPSLLVVSFGHPVITGLSVFDFNRGGLPAPNEWCYQAVIQTYNDITFVAGEMLLTTSRCDILVDEESQPSYVRDLSAFTTAGTSPRGQGYRYRDEDGITTDNGAVISIQGLNFGDSQGTVWLDAFGTPVQATEFQPGPELPGGWSDTEIRIYLPAALQSLSGTVKVVPAGSAVEAFSREPLACSPYVLGITRDWDYENGSGRITLAGFDYQPQVVPGRIGTDIYSIWVVRASYTDPWGSGLVTNYGFLTTPIPPHVTAGTAMRFLFSDLDVDGNGTVPLEVMSASGTESAVVEGELAPGDYFFFLWTGVLGEGSPEEIAMSGVFSESYVTEYPVYASPNQPPVAVLSATPSSGSVPLYVSFDATASYDPDGVIIDYEWDFDGDGTYNEPGDEAAARGNPGPYTYSYYSDGSYTARLRVTDDGPPPHSDVTTHHIQTGIGPNGNVITVNVTMRDFSEFTTTSNSMIRLYDGNPEDGGTLLQQHVLDHQAAGNGNPATHVLYDLPDNTDYYIRVINHVAYWDGDAAPPPYGYKDLGPYTVPPNQVVNLSGYQYCEPPGPASPGPN